MAQLQSTPRLATGLATRLATRMQWLQPSPVRDILHLINRPDVVSFAGGLPATECLPAARDWTLPQQAWQYGPSEGEPALRALAATILQRRGIEVGADRVLILSGSQQGIDLVSKLLLDAGSRVLAEAPTYLAALQVFRLYGAEIADIKFPVTIGSQATAQRLPLQPSPSGDTDQLPVTRHPADADASATLLYTIANFQNPTGHVYTAEQRQQLAALARHTGAVLFEDDPYHELAYDPCERRPICADIAACDDASNWVYQSSFSKVLAPGLRLGFLTCSEALWPYLVALKQAADLHSSRIGQQLALQILSAPTWPCQLEQQVSIYRQKRDRFQQLLTRELAGLASWDMPKGGLFFWLKINRDAGQHADSWQLMHRALEQGVAIMPGDAFFADGLSAPGLNPESQATTRVLAREQSPVIEDACRLAGMASDATTHAISGAASRECQPAQQDCYIRLNFSHADEASMELGIKRLRQVLESVG